MSFTGQIPIAFGVKALDFNWQVSITVRTKINNQDVKKGVKVFLFLVNLLCGVWRCNFVTRGQQQFTENMSMYPHRA